MLRQKSDNRVSRFSIEKLGLSGWTQAAACHLLMPAASRLRRELTRTSRTFGMGLLRPDAQVCTIDVHPRQTWSASKRLKTPHGGVFFRPHYFRPGENRQWFALQIN